MEEMTFWNPPTDEELDEEDVPATISAADMKNLTCLFTEKDMDDWIKRQENGTDAWGKFVRTHIDSRERVKCPFCDRIMPRASLTTHLNRTLFKRNGNGGDGYKHGSRADPDEPNASIYRTREWA